MRQQKYSMFVFKHPLISLLISTKSDSALGLIDHCHPVRSSFMLSLFNECGDSGCWLTSWQGNSNFLQTLYTTTVKPQKVWSLWYSSSWLWRYKAVAVASQELAFGSQTLVRRLLWCSWALLACCFVLATQVVAKQLQWGSMWLWLCMFNDGVFRYLPYQNPLYNFCLH